jgi:hypothetical protein
MSWSGITSSAHYAGAAHIAVRVGYGYDTDEPAVQLRSPRSRSAGSYVPPWRGMPRQARMHAACRAP